MLEYGSPEERAEARIKAADAACDAKALNALAADMALHDPANVDAGLGLPLVMTGSDATARLNEMIGTTPGHKPSRTDAASLSDTQARRKACRVVEAAAYDALLASGLTMEQMVLLGAYNDSIHATRKAELDMHFAMFAKGGSL